MNLQAGYWDIFFPQFVQGCGIALMFVPLTTVTMASISPEKMGGATSLFNLMRNIGGSVGIAVPGTMLVRQRQSVSAALGEHISTFNPAATARLAQMKAAFMAAGADAATATNQAYSAMAGLLFRQATMLSFVMLFRALALVCLCMIPLVLLMKRAKPRVHA